jgi:hypothetical protein
MLRTVVPQIIKASSTISQGQCQCQSEANKAEYARTAQIIGTITKKLELNETIRDRLSPTGQMPTKKVE